MNLLRASVRYVMAGLLLIFAAVPASASHDHWGGQLGGWTYDGFTFQHSTEVWKQDYCTQPGGYSVMFYQHANFEGNATRVCRGTTRTGGGTSEGDACAAPMSSGFHQWAVNVLECHTLGIDAYVLDDKVSSLKVLNGFGNRCLHIFAEPNWTGAWRQFDADTNYANLENAVVSSTGIGFNDKLSSWKIADCDPSARIF
jgi:hypothetical protein